MSEVEFKIIEAKFHNFSNPSKYFDVMYRISIMK